MEQARRGIVVAGAIIEHPVHGFLLQLRDAAAPTYPSCWGLFGGHVEPGESPQYALWRELREELAFTPAMAQTCRLVQRNARRGGGMQYIFYIRTQATLGDLVLGEGEAMRFFPAGAWAGRPLTATFAQIMADHLAGRRDDEHDGE
ncbi:MAG: NUDIX domain-containing protein [Caldilineaceae bacterium]|nr:NUDIX domain-containing protein [Caldilineaceae bacterium]